MVAGGRPELYIMASLIISLLPPKLLHYEEVMADALELSQLRNSSGLGKGVAKFRHNIILMLSIAEPSDSAQIPRGSNTPTPYTL